MNAKNERKNVKRKFYLQAETKKKCSLLSKYELLKTFKKCTAQNQEQIKNNGTKRKKQIKWYQKRSSVPKNTILKSASWSLSKQKEANKRFLPSDEFSYVDKHERQYSQKPCEKLCNISKQKSDTFDSLESFATHASFCAPSENC